MNTKALFLSLSLFLFLSGCLNVFEGFEDYTKFETSPEYELKMELKECPTQNCICFVCKSNTPLTPPFNLILSASFKKGTCYFKENCDGEEVQTLIKSTDEGLMPFMLGIGPRFVDFADANVYCNNTMRMAVQWLTPRYLGGEYVLPEEEVAECLLDKMVIPVYVLYSDSKSVSPEQAEEIAEKLNAQGPVIIIAEIDFNSSNEDTIHAVQNQILRMRSKCPRTDAKNNPYCLLAVAPKMGDQEGLDKVMSNSYVADSVDLIAVGVNSHYSTKCSAAYTFYEAMNFSKYAHFKYNKPIIWPYMLFDPGATNKDGTCTWEEYEVSKAYYTFYNYLPVFISNGVIGAAAYEYYSSDEITDPLKCNNCGLVSFETGTAAPKDPAFSSWFYGCQKYGAQKNIMPAIFSKEDGGTCNYLTNIGLFVQTEITTGSPASILDVEDVESRRIFTCVPCLASCTETESAECNPYGISAASGGSSKCDEFEELNYWASIRGLDPLYVRAIAWQESSLDTENPESSICAASYPVAFSKKACNIANYPVILDPSGVCDDYIHAHSDYTGKTGADYVGVEDGKVTGTPWLVDKYNGYIANGMSPEEAIIELEKITGLKPCGLGIMQNVQYPYDIAEEEKTWGSDSADLEIPTMCAPDGKYNPYNITHSACLGTYKLKYRWEYFEGMINNDPVLFGIDDNDPVKINYVTGLIVAYSYQGGWKEQWISDFVSQSETDPELCDYDNTKKECCGNKNFITYISTCAAGNNQYGVDILEKYVSLKNACGAEYGCPPAVNYQNIEKFSKGE